jgi:hypothetical protein
VDNRHLTVKKAKADVMGKSWQSRDGDGELRMKTEERNMSPWASKS